MFMSNCCCDPCRGSIGFWGGYTQGGGLVDFPIPTYVPVQNAIWTIDFPAGTEKYFNRNAGNLDVCEVLLVDSKNLPTAATDFDAIAQWTSDGGRLFVVWDYHGVSAFNYQPNIDRMNTFLSYIGALARWNNTLGAAPSGLTTTPTNVFTLSAAQQAADPLLRNVSRFHPSAPGFMDNNGATVIVRGATAPQLPTDIISRQYYGSGIIYTCSDANLFTNPSPSLSDNDVLLSNLACPQDDCFGCATKNNFGYPAGEITLTCSGFSWSVPETSTTSETLGYFFNSQYGTVTYGFTSIDIANLNGSKQLRRNPNGSCVWLWNQVLATESKWQDGYPPSLQQATYEPLNPTDATSPWGRVLRTNQFTGCTVNTCYSIPYPNIGAAVTVSQDGEEYRLRMTVSFIVGRWALPGAVSLGITAYPPAVGGVPWKATPVGYAMIGFDQMSPYSGSLSTGNGATPPYKYVAAYGTINGLFPLGGVLVVYESEPIECSEAFFGNPITLTNTHEFDDRVAGWDAVVPDAVEVTF